MIFKRLWEFALSFSPICLHRNLGIMALRGKRPCLDCWR